MVTRLEAECALVFAGGAAGLPEAEVRATVASGLNAGVLKPRDRSKVTGASGAPPPPPSEPEPPKSDTNGDDGPASAPADPVPPPAPKRTVLPFPLRVFPPDLVRFIEEGSRALCCPPDYFAIPMLVAAASMIGAARTLRMTPDWYVLPSLYAALVAPPSSSKSPAAARSLAAVKQQQQRNYSAFKAAKAAWEAEEPSIRGASPTFQRTYFTDSTTEKMAALLAECPRGLLMHRDELTAWVESFDQYHARGKGADRQVYMTIWDSQPISIERQKHEHGLPITVSHPCLNIFGTTQPDALHRLTRNNELDGFVERVLFGFPDPVDVRVWHWGGISECARQSWVRILRNLYSLVMGARVEDDQFDPEPIPLVMDLSDSGRLAWEKWFASHQNRVRATEDVLSSANAKLEAYTARFSLIITLLWHAAEEPELDPRACPLVEGPCVELAGELSTYFSSHAERAYGYLSRDDDDKAVERAIAWLKRRGGHCTATEMYRSHVGGCKGLTDALALLNKLADRGLGQIASHKHPVNGETTTTFKLYDTV
jgi:hypothetical protein